MADFHLVPIDGGVTVSVCFTDVEDGDFRVRDPLPSLAKHRAAIHDGPWSWILQVHEADVLAVDHPGHRAGAVADGLHTTALDAPIAVTTADCAPVVLIAERGVAVVHAGWRGLVAGVVETAGDRLVESAGRPVAAMLGPCIGPSDYQFGRTELDQVVDRYGPEVEGLTADGDPALDVPAAVGAACALVGWPRPQRPRSTSDPRWFSHRTRGDVGRQTAVAWLHRNGEQA